MLALALTIASLGFGPLVAAGPPEVTPAGDDVVGLAARGPELATRFECNRCHVGHDLAPVAPDKACVGCHIAIEAGTFDAPKDVLARWQDNLVDLTVAPSLDGASRFRRDWLERFLLSPHAHDVRPLMTAQMPRLALSPGDARALAAWLAGPEPTTPPDGLWTAGARAGRRLAETKGCGTCHQMSGLAGGLVASPVPVPIAKDALASAMLLAPDLRLARERLRPQGLVRWLVRPSAVKPGTAMPDLPLTRLEAEDLAAFLLEAPLAPPAPRPIPARLPLLTRRVEFAEVKARVFRRTCWHCHSEPDLALGDGGPGNTGGFGFPGRALSLVDATTIVNGSIGDDGRRRSIFKAFGPIAGPVPAAADGRPAVDAETSRLMVSILARQVEEAGGEVPGVRGMPLGLPSLTPEDVQLVESWLAQGRPE